MKTKGALVLNPLVLLFRIKIAFVETDKIIAKRFTYFINKITYFRISINQKKLLKEL
jgi:hypothetical protein